MIAATAVENRSVRILVYTDYAYRRAPNGQVLSDRAFSIFIAAVAAQAGAEFKLLGRVAPDPQGGHYPIGDRAELEELPYYASLTSRAAIPGLFAALRRCWRAIGDADVIWSLGPHPLAVAIAWFALIRRRRLVLGVRQDSIAYVKARHPRRRLIHLAAWMLEAGFRAAAHWAPVVAVGPEVAGRYRNGREVLSISVSLVEPDSVVSTDQATGRSFEAPRTILSVGRLETEKNPLMLADLLQRLDAVQPGEWRLTVCGEGDLECELRDRIEALGLSGQATLAGYVPFGAELERAYRNAHMLVSCSWTEGLPQVLVEALAAGLPVVSTDVGGIGEELGAAVALVQPGDAAEMAEVLTELASDAALRRNLIEAGHAYAVAHTIDIEAGRVADLLIGVDPSGDRGAGPKKWT